MNIRECTTADHEWRETFQTLPIDLQDIYFSPSYYQVYEKVYGLRPQCLVFQDSNDIALYPFLLSSLNKLSYIDLDREYCDIEGAYGYNGIISTSDDRQFISGIVRTMTEYCRDNGIIAEFTRFNPVYKNHEIAAHLDITNVNRNVLVDLTEKDIWQNAYEHSSRKNIKKAERSGLSTTVTDGNDVTPEQLDVFVNIYKQTMERNAADDFYFFPRDYFESMFRFNGFNTKLFFTIKDEISIACELVLHGGSVAYSFLGGTLSDYYDCRPNDILKHSIIEHLRHTGCTCFCLGGGVTDGDGIFRYKKSFSKNGVVDFFIGKKIHNALVYNQVVNAWSEKFPDKCDKYQNLLLKYRY